MLSEAQKKTRATMRAAVKKGAAMLDDANPKWFKKIDLDTLNLASCTACVAGQLAQRCRGYECTSAANPTYSDYLLFLRRKLSVGGHIYGRIGLGSTHGFVIPPGAITAEGSGKAAYAVQEKMWEREIRTRLKAAA